MLFFCRSFLGGVGIRSRKLETVGRAQRVQKENTHTTTIPTTKQPPRRGPAGAVGSASPSWLLCFFSLSQQGSAQAVASTGTLPCTSVALGCHPLPQKKQAGRAGQRRQLAPPPRAVLRPGNLERGTQLDGNFGISQETIVGEEGVGCCVRFLYFPGVSVQVTEGERLPGLFLPFPTLQSPDSGGE